MITKTQASKIASDYATGVGTRVEQALVNAAASGQVGLINYPYPTNVPVQFLTDIKNALQAAGWTVTVDQVNFLVTIA